MHALVARLPLFHCVSVPLARSWEMPYLY